MGGITLGYLYLAVLGEASGYTHIYIALNTITIAEDDVDTS